MDRGGEQVSKERYFVYDPYSNDYYCKKCDKNHRGHNSLIGMKHRCFGVDPFLGFGIVSFNKKEVAEK